MKVKLLSLAAGACVSSLAAAAPVPGLDGWDTVGDANWSVEDGVIRADRGSGFLVSHAPMSDFELSLEFRSGPNTNSGVFVRCTDPATISDTSCYEANIFDGRPDPSGRTGAIVGVAPPRVSINTEGRWNTYEIRARGSHLVVTLNGVVTVDTHDARLTAGNVALQLAAGAIEFRHVVMTSAINLERGIVGVWELTGFDLDDGAGTVEPWCEGAHGSIMYSQGHMSVAINCPTDINKRVFYAGRYHLDGDTVVHGVRQYSDAGLNQTFRRQVVMTTEDRLTLVGPMGASGQVLVTWERRE